MKVTDNGDENDVDVTVYVKKDKKYLQALEHLNPAHEYGVAFERGTRLTLDVYKRQYHNRAIPRGHHYPQHLQLSKREWERGIYRHR